VDQGGRDNHELQIAAGSLFDELSNTSLMKKPIACLRSICGATIIRDQWRSYLPKMAENGPGFRIDQLTEQVMGVDAGEMLTREKQQGRGCNEANMGTSQCRHQ
jgi:hypothetical protein